MSDNRKVIEWRAAETVDVKFPERTVTVLAVPYERPTDTVVYRGKQYVEVFARGAFNGIEKRPKTVAVNREHVKGMTVGKVETFHPDATEGLIAEIRMASTPAGDEALTLADERMIWPSVGFYVKQPSDQELNNRSNPPQRWIKRAFVEHLSLVEGPAYVDVDIVSVRSDEASDIAAADLATLNTPNLDEWVAYVASRRAGVAS